MFDLWLRGGIADSHRLRQETEQCVGQKVAKDEKKRCKGDDGLDVMDTFCIQSSSFQYHLSVQLKEAGDEGVGEDHRNVERQNEDDGEKGSCVISEEEMEG